MKASRALVCLLVALAAVSPVLAQTTVEEAREEGRKLGNETRRDSSLVPTDSARAEAVPGYAGTALPEGNFFDDPDRLEAAGASARHRSEPYRITVDGDRTRPAFSNDEILATTRRATSIENDPSTYLDGEEMGGSAGVCTPLPPGTDATGYYEASCNRGSQLTEETRSCTPVMVPRTTTRQAYKYYAAGDGVYGAPFPREGDFAGALANGSCWASGASMGGCAASVAVGYRSGNKFCGDYSVRAISCTSEIVSNSPEMPATGKLWYARTNELSVTVERSDASCQAYAGDGQCVPSGPDQCTQGEETRLIDGVAITQPCWEWRRTYQCNFVSPASDCSELEANNACSFVRTECLDDDPDGACRVEERIYRCPAPGSNVGGATQYICGDDVYCINGDCEPIVREASTELKDALVALHAIDQAGKEFDEDDLSLFRGARETCHKPVFGLINCCAGKASGLLSAGAGAAAIAAGPAGIAALATPFLTLFACSQDEKKLDIRDRMGFCHKVGTYCSSSILGICKTKRTAYCCFESKLSRVFQEQGRTQLGKPWDKPKTEQCLGFTIDEFARLDLSVMDFTEVYADFMDAAKLPDEVEAMTQIQQRIEGYYDLHGK
ncbi:conjugal transfer protein TraN [Sphingopyxis macrogoltabida]|uniref:Conjugal transfer protein TraN n=1 Tax=Sphingopyxis macrogoltabida TaxID=33050 RepID=A0AAC9AYR1_SPHMC|nr:conjugal transfer protein TraN [Sphingopyxis macrogoltabida]ALJ16289.1 conjugal transfer protein TraN [Sphingopyxis macrogoltabida]AMU92526.1 conjugal transfer protein TraN [Sphingopyxis macrogoltabida]